MRCETMNAFVLSRFDYGESDLIVSLFTLEHGRIKGFAARARNSRKRFGAALELLAQSNMEIHLKDGLSSLKRGEIKTLYPEIRGNLSAIASAIYSAELIDVMTPEGVAFPRLFRLFSTWLDYLETGAATESDRRFFEINLLNILGYRPSLDHCSRCNSDYNFSGAILQAEGEIVCHNCGKVGFKISTDTLNKLVKSLKTGSFGKIDFSGETLVQAGKLLDEAMAHHAGRNIKSLKFLNHIACE